MLLQYWHSSIPEVCIPKTLFPWIAYFTHPVLCRSGQADRVAVCLWSKNIRIVFTQFCSSVARILDWIHISDKKRIKKLSLFVALKNMYNISLHTSLFQCNSAFSISPETAPHLCALRRNLLDRTHIYTHKHT